MAGLALFLGVLVIFLTVLVSSVRSHVVSLTDMNFDDSIFGGTSHFVLFYAPWCEHCQTLLPKWDQLAEQYKTRKRQIAVAKVDCKEETPLCAKQTIKAYPTMRLYTYGEVKRYNGKRSVDELKSFVNGIVFKNESPENLADTAVPNNGLYDLTKDNFDSHVEFGLHFVEFYAPWCSHCRKLAPTWAKLAEEFKDSSDITIARIDCTTHGKKCTEHEVHAFPILKLFKDGRAVDVYDGSRKFEDLKTYVEIKVAEHAVLSTATTTKSETAEEVPPETTMPEGDLIKAITLSEDNFDGTISVGTTFVKFYVPWCKHCRALAPVWDQLAKKCAEHLAGPTIARVDCTVEETLCQNFGISGFPTLLMFKDGVQKQEYIGSRDVDSLYRFAMQYHDEL